MSVRMGVIDGGRQRRKLGSEVVAASDRRATAYRRLVEWFSTAYNCCWIESNIRRWQDLCLPAKQ